MSRRNLHLDIGISGAFLTRRWEEPDNWMRLTADCGFSYHEFCGDVLDPFFSGDHSFQAQTAESVKAAAERYGVRFSYFYTGSATYRFHGLSHSHPAVRARMRDWILAYMDLSLACGCTRVGGRLDALSSEVLAHQDRHAEAWARTIEEFRSLAVVAKEKGLDSLCNEQMYAPSLKPWTIEGSYGFLKEANRDSGGVPVYLTVDVGHMAQMHFGCSDCEDLDYAAWLRHFAPVAENVHLQQTVPDASCHWPLTSERNAQGHVNLERVLEAIQEGHERWSTNPLCGQVPPVERTILTLEVIPGTTKRDDQLVQELTESCEYMREFVPTGGLTWQFAA